MMLYMHFLAYTLNEVCRMNQEFQTERPIVHLLHDRMVAFYRLLLSNFLRKSYIDSTDIELIDPKSEINKKTNLNDVYAGPDAEYFIDENLVPEPKLQLFRKNILSYYQELCHQIRSRYDFSDSGVLKKLYLIDPKYIFVESESVKSILPLLKHFKDVFKKNYREIESEYRLLQNMAQMKERYQNKGIEDFWQSVSTTCSGDGKHMFKSISDFAKSMLCLPHSSAEVERVFSSLNQIKTKLRNRLEPETCEAILLAKDLLKTTGQSCYNYQKLTSIKPPPITQCDDNENDTFDEVLHLM